MYLLKNNIIAGIFDEFQINLKQTEDLEEDEESQCRSYNISERSYKSFVMTKIESEYMASVNCLPPWFTNDYGKVCQGPLNSTEIGILERLIYKHFDLTEFVGCKHPCTRYDMTSRIIRFPFFC